MDYKSGFNSGNIDLHIHSTASDGSYDPTEIPTLAQKIGLKAFALTDHDSIEGVRKILAHRHLLGPTHFLTGVEISAAPPDFFRAAGSFHLLGYGFEIDHPALNQTLLEQQAARKNRNPDILQRLNTLGMDLTLDQVIAASEEKAQIGRPHIARVMVKNGFARSIDEAFDLYLGKGKPAYIDKPRVETAQALELIRAAGGIPVLAHPGLLEIPDFDAYEYLISELIPMGLMGVEAYYPNHSAEETDYFIELTERFNLLVTGGSDFHGAINPDIHLGSGNGNMAVPYTIYERLTEELSWLKSSGSIQ